VKFTFGAGSSAASVIPTSDSTAKIVGVSPATVGIQAVGEGVTGNASLLVLARVFLAGSVSNTTIDVGDAISCGLISLGHGYCWGLNNHGQIAARTDSTCFPGTDPGTIVNDSLKSTALPCSLLPLRISESLDFATISAGDSTGCAISTAGRAYCWGMGTHGENGNGNTADKTTPSLVTSGLTFTSISVGGMHVCAIATGGAAYCWGDDSFGQLGDARRVSSTTPIPVSGGGGPATFASISAGLRHTCALTSDGTAYCWGYNDLGQLGDGSGATTDTPVQVAGGFRFTWISAGGDHTCGITTSGAALCWGSNLNGQLGTGTSGDVAFAPVAVAGGLTFTRISASTGTRFKINGRGHTCALTSAGAAYCWGDNTDLQIGTGQFTGGNGMVTSPVQVAQGERGAGVTFTSISAGSRHSCAVGSDGNAYCWGSNVMGALGNTLQAAFRGQPQKVATPR
jgi:alpha-tubulin suppressor-like RCC1 family protein